MRPVRQPSPSTAPKLLFVGDPHGDFSVAIRAVDKHRPDAVILLGDLQARRPLQLELAPILDRTEVWFIHGNRDTDSETDHDNLFKSDLIDRNLHGRVIDICGLQVAGLGGVFRESAWAPPLEPVYSKRQALLRNVMHKRWRDGIPLRHRSSIFPEDIAGLARRRADILVSHEAPRGHRHGWKALDNLATVMGVRLLVHGHHHEQIDYAAAGRLPAGGRCLVYGVARKGPLLWSGGAAEFDGGIE